MIKKIIFHQRIVSPHMAALCSELADLGFSVVYCASIEMSKSRKELGWSTPDLGKAELLILNNTDDIDSFILNCRSDSVHICQGLRGNGLVSYAQKKLIKKGFNIWVVMESINDSGFLGFIKKIEYTRLIFKMRNKIDGFLSIGNSTSEWLVSRGADKNKVFDFAYFLRDRSSLCCDIYEVRPYSFIFVGQHIKRKRLSLLIDSLDLIKNKNFTLTIVGSGTLEESLKESAIKKLGKDKVNWLGKLAMEDVLQTINRADCLVCPSEFDGWGAVISEALMAGTSVICSDSCGASGVVSLSSTGMVFKTGCVDELSQKLVKSIEIGKRNVVQRNELSSWASSLGAVEGAAYLLSILNSSENKPLPPWSKKC